MASAIYFDSLPGLAGTLEYPTSRGRCAVNHGVSISQQLLSTDAIGTYALTLTNVVVGSRVHIQGSDNTTLYDAVAASSTVVPSLSVYAPGSPLNSLTIKVRKASAAPYYQPWETQATAVVGSNTIYVSQIPD